MVSAGAPMRKSCQRSPLHLCYVWLKKKDSYFTDSLTNKIYAYDYNDGELSNRRVFIDAIAQGLPENTFCDGLCVDDEGCVWSARFVLGLFSAGTCLIFKKHRWGGSRILRFTPDGTIDTQIVFPTALNITACCFGGMQQTYTSFTTLT